MEYIKQKIVEDTQSRKALYERLLFDLKDAPDPWKDFERARVDIRQFKSIPIIEENHAE
jgi:nitrite reductase (NADH) large subunit